MSRKPTKVITAPTERVQLAPCIAHAPGTAAQAISDAKRYAYGAGKSYYVWHQPISSGVAVAARYPVTSGGLDVIVRVQPCGTLYFVTLSTEHQATDAEAITALNAGVR